MMMLMEEQNYMPSSAGQPVNESYCSTKEEEKGNFYNDSTIQAVDNSSGVSGQSVQMTNGSTWLAYSREAHGLITTVRLGEGGHKTHHSVRLGEGRHKTHHSS